MFELNTPETPQIHIQSSLSNTYLSVSRKYRNEKKYILKKKISVVGKCEKFELIYKRNYVKSKKEKLTLNKKPKHGVSCLLNKLVLN